MPYSQALLGFERDDGPLVLRDLQAIAEEAKQQILDPDNGGKEDVARGIFLVEVRWWPNELRTAPRDWIGQLRQADRQRQLRSAATTSHWRALLQSPTHGQVPAPF